MSKPLAGAIALEARKLAASRIVRSASMLLIGGIAVLTGALIAAAEAGNEQVLAQLGDIADKDGWSRLNGLAVQITGVGSVLGFGTVLAWVVGREFTDDTIGGLFAIPVRRPTIAFAKLTVTSAWTALVSVVIVAMIAVVGAVVIGSPNGDAVAGLGRLLVLTWLSGLLATPAAWAATRGRGLLPGVAVTIMMIAVAQVVVVIGGGAWVPVAAPALWALDPDDVSPLQLGLVTLVPAVFTVLTMRAWSRLQLDR